MILFSFVLPFFLMAQQKKENDFMVASMNNPSFCIFDFLSVSKLNSRNTQFLTEAEYRNSKFIQRKVTEYYGQYNDQKFHEIYVNVSNAWRIFKEVENTDISYDGMGKYMMKRDYFDTRRTESCPFPDLKRKLCVIPFSGRIDDRIKF